MAPSIGDSDAFNNAYVVSLYTVPRLVKLNEVGEGPHVPGN